MQPFPRTWEARAVGGHLGAVLLDQRCGRDAGVELREVAERDHAVLVVAQQILQPLARLM